MTAMFQPGVQECPHCLARVLIVSNGLCPGYQRDARDLSTVNPDRKSLWIRPNDKVFPLCHQCGASCDRITSIKHTQAWETTDDVPKSRNLLAIVIGFLFGWAWYILIRDKGANGNGRRYETVVLRVPQCGLCSSKPIEQVAASIEDNALKLVTHRAFEAEFERLNDFPAA